MTQNEELKSMLKRSQKGYGYLGIISGFFGIAGLILGAVFPQSDNTTVLIAVSFALMAIFVSMLSLSETYRDLQQIVPEPKEDRT